MMMIGFQIERAAFTIRDQDDLDGLAELAAVGTRSDAEAADCLKRLLSKRRRNRQGNRQGKPATPGKVCDP